jgi:hypothetical protein
MVEDRVWRGFERQLQEIVNLPGVQEYWGVRSSWYSDAFQEYVDRALEVGAVVEPQDYMGGSCTRT